MTLCGMPYEDPGYDCEPVELWEEKLVTARKRWGCEECGATIEPGEKHGRAKGLYDGDWFTLRRCQACLVLAELVATVTGECAQWGRLHEYIEEADEWFPSPHEHREQWEKT